LTPPPSGPPGPLPPGNILPPLIDVITALPPAGGAAPPTLPPITMNTPPQYPPTQRPPGGGSSSGTSNPGAPATTPPPSQQPSPPGTQAAVPAGPAQCTQMQYCIGDWGDAYKNVPVIKEYATTPTFLPRKTIKCFSTEAVAHVALCNDWLAAAKLSSPPDFDGWMQQRSIYGGTYVLPYGFCDDMASLKAQAGRLPQDSQASCQPKQYADLVPAAPTTTPPPQEPVATPTAGLGPPQEQAATPTAGLGPPQEQAATPTAGLGPPPNSPAAPPPAGPSSPGNSTTAMPTPPVVPVPVNPPAPQPPTARYNPGNVCNPTPPAPPKPGNICNPAPPALSKPGNICNPSTPSKAGNAGQQTAAAPPQNPQSPPIGRMNSGECHTVNGQTTCTDASGNSCTTTGGFCDPTAPQATKTAAAPIPPKPNSGPLILKPSTQMASAGNPGNQTSQNASVPACSSKPPYLPWGGHGSATIMVSGGEPCGVGWHDTPGGPGGVTVLDSMTVTSHPSHGTLTPKDQHVIIFTPAPGYKGQDSFTLTMREHNGGRSATLSVKVSVTIQ
jgi:Bacterial Ig domain